jgi:hypothetical protein
MILYLLLQTGKLVWGKSGAGQRIIGMSSLPVGSQTMNPQKHMSKRQNTQAFIEEDLTVLEPQSEEE